MTDAPQHSQQPAASARPKATPRVGRDVKVGAACGLVVGLMVGAAYASVPFYDWFCRVTGFNGTTQVAGEAPQSKPLERTVAVRFDSNVSGGLPWKFEPVENTVTVRLGENRLVAFRAMNDSGVITRGTATYNVTPFAGGRSLAQMWRIPPENLFERDQGHFSAAIGLGVDPAPYARMFEILSK